MNKKSLVSIIILHILSVIVGTIIVIVGKKTCRTSACKNASADISNRIMNKIDPCQDFYTFACGTSGSMIRQISEEANTRMINFFDKPIDSQQPRAFALGKEFFKQCLKKESNEVIKKNIKKLVSKVGGFPTLDGNDWDEVKWSFEGAIKLYTEAGLYTDMIIRIDPNFNPLNRYTEILVTKIPNFIYPKDCGDSCKEFYIDLYTTYAVKLGADNKTASTDAKDVVEFEMQLINVTKKLIPVFNPGLKDYVRSLAQFSTAFNFLDWNKYFEGLLGSKPPESKTTHFIVASNYEYLLYLNSHFRRYSKRLLANYMFWYNLQFFKYHPDRDPDKLECLYNTKGHLTVMISAIALNLKHVTGYNIVEGIITNIREEMKQSIDKSDWMDDHTKKEADAKLENLRENVGYYDLFRDYSLVDKYYEDLSLGDDYLQSLRKIIQHYTKKQRSKCYFGSLSDTECKLYVFSSQVMMYDLDSAFYLPGDNSINIPDPTLQPPIFDHEWPKYINYGRLGLAIGHELIHGFDVDGSTINKDGQLMYWWTEKTFNQYGKKAQCLDDRYSNISFFNGEKVEKVNGYVTEKENVADVGGLKLAFQAYQRMASRRLMNELPLPDLNYSELQLFFISAAQYWCDTYKSKPEYGWAFYNNKFVPQPIRVTGSMQNSPHFGEVFGCKPGDVMNPTVKCEVW